MAIAEATVEGVAGAAGAIIATVATHPLSTISTLQAVQKQDRQQGDSRGSDQSNSRSLLRELLHREGWRKLYDGLKPAVLGAGLSQGVYFYFYSALRDLLLAQDPPASLVGRKLHAAVSSGSPSLSPANALVVASVAGCCNVLLTNPIWVLATRLQTDARRVGRPRSLLEAFQQACREEGYQWAYKGVVPSLIMVCNPTVQYVLYEWLMARLRQWKVAKKVKNEESLKPTAIEVFFISALAKLGATLVTYPILLVKSRLQVGGENGIEGLAYRGTLHAIQTILAEEGFLGFYKGMGAKIVQSVLAAALMLMIKEKLADFTRYMLARS